MAAPESVPSPDVQSLYVDHHPWLLTWLRARLGDRFAAADVAQDTFVDILRAGTVASIREPRPFLVTVARRLMARRHRRQRLETDYLDWLASLPPASAPSPEAQYTALQTLHQLDQALAQLSRRASEVFLLAHLERLSYAAIAERLGVSLSTVKQDLSRANRLCLFVLEP